MCDGIERAHKFVNAMGSPVAWGFRNVCGSSVLQPRAASRYHQCITSLLLGFRSFNFESG